MKNTHVAKIVKLSRVAEIVKLTHVARILEAASMYDPCQTLHSYPLIFSFLAAALLGLPVEFIFQLLNL